MHYDGDGSKEGWFRTADGNWMASEPVGTEDWMPLNDYPTAKPTYDSGPGAWQLAPSKRSAATYLDLYAVYERPKAALIALRQALGARSFDAALHSIQRRYAGSSITEPRFEAAFAALLPNHSAARQRRLSQFFTQWFDTAYHGSKPQITGPGLHGHPFYAHGCTAPRRR